MFHGPGGCSQDTGVPPHKPRNEPVSSLLQRFNTCFGGTILAWRKEQNRRPWSPGIFRWNAAAPPSNRSDDKANLLGAAPFLWIGGVTSPWSSAWPVQRL